MLIATFNCNSVRQRLPHILDWLSTHDPDVLAVQETKVQDADFPRAAFEEAGWQVVFRGQKSYNGVATITREPVESASFGLQDGDDNESGPRLAHVRYRGIEIINSYVPQGRALQHEQFAFKLEWFARLKRYLAQRFDPETDQVVWLGDLNVAPTAADVHDPKRIWPHVCYSQPVIDAWQSVMDWGLVDVFRRHISPESASFTFWDYRVPSSVERGRGWRIDHIVATANLAEHSSECFVDIEPRLKPKPSDHTFVAARFDV